MNTENPKDIEQNILLATEEIMNIFKSGGSEILIRSRVYFTLYGLHTVNKQKENQLV